MIIKLTVKDNDFYYIIKDFMKNMWRFWYPQKDIDKMSSEEIQAETQKIFHTSVPCAVEIINLFCLFFPSISNSLQ